MRRPIQRHSRDLSWVWKLAVVIAIAAGGWFYYQQQQREEFVKVQAARQAQQPVEVSQEEYDAIQADIAKEEARLKRRKNRPTVKGVNNSSFNGAQMGGH